MKYIDLCEIYDKLGETSKRLEKTHFIAKLLKKTKTEDLDTTLLLLQGKLFPDYEEDKIGVASRLVLKAISVSTGDDISRVEDKWKKIGDLGEVAKELTDTKKQRTLFSQDLSVKKVFSNLRKLAELGGQGSTDHKVQLIAELLTSAQPVEAKYIVRTVLEEMRIGVGEGSVRDAIVWSCFPKIVGIFFKCDKCKKYVPSVKKCVECDNDIDNKFKKELESFKNEALDIKSVDDIKHLEKYEFIKAEDEKTAREAYNYLVEQVQNAYDLTNNFAEITECIRKHGLEGLFKLNIKPGKPIKVMLYPKAKDIEDAFETLGKPAAFEYKYDGFRILVSKDNNKVHLFTRRLDDVTTQFPDIVSYVKTHIKGKSFIIDSEAVGFDAKTKKYLPFQSISQRIKRKYEIEKMAKEFPVELNVFDIVFYEGESLLKKPFMERRKLIEKIVRQSSKEIVLAKQLVTDDVKKAEKFYKEALAVGEEGVMAKSLDGIYKPGSRVGYGVKIKPTFEPLDLVIIGAQWGEGKRATWLSSFEIACRDDNDKFVSIGKVGTGIKELESEEGVTFEELTKMLKPLIISETGKSVKVKPKEIIEVGYSEIQKSPTYESGFALRFPRLIRIRTMEKGLNDVTDLDYIKKLYNQQKK
jgi:DNA ligase-1